MPELSRQSGKLDINIEDNVEFSMTATYKISGTPVDVTGYTASFTLRDVNGQTGDPLLELTHLAGITVGTTNGVFVIAMTDAQCNFGDREMIYDLVITSPTGNDIRLLRGKCKSWSGAHV